jgi:hypothetical protein
MEMSSPPGERVRRERMVIQRRSGMEHQSAASRTAMGWRG